MSTMAVELDPAEPEPSTRPAGTAGTGALVVPACRSPAVLVALADRRRADRQGGENPFAVYADVCAACSSPSAACRSTAHRRTPLIFMGLGLAIAYRAKLFTIGAEGQFVLGATAAVAVVTAEGVRDLPGFVLVVLAIVVAGVVGRLWSGISAVLANRFNTSIVISSLLLAYIAAAVMQWMIRKGIKDPKSFVPASRVIGHAAPADRARAQRPPRLRASPSRSSRSPGSSSPAAASASASTSSATTRWPCGPTRCRPDGWCVAVLAIVGVLSGVAGYVEVAGVTNRINGEFSAGYGFTAIIVALLGRLHPVGVLVAALGGVRR